MYRPGRVTSCLAFFVAASAPYGAASATDAMGHPEAFTDCADCPEMIRVPAGEYRMGSPESETGRGENEGPVHTVTISKPFAIGRYEVTRGQFRQFVEATGYEPKEGCEVFGADGWEDLPERNWRGPGFDQDDTHPVVCISREDAMAYVEWLSEASGHAYRLPTESEWEYAARAGTSTPYFFGDDASAICQFANGADQSSRLRSPAWTWSSDCTDGYPFSAPVGSFEPNRFGLSDVTANVWEWVADCYEKTYNEAPADGSAHMTADCDAHVLRGGGLFDSPGVLRIAVRWGYAPNGRTFETGFRVARSLSTTQ